MKMEIYGLKNESKHLKTDTSNQIRKKCTGDFRFVELIGEGSFSLVYLALDAEVNRLYAIKVCEKKQIQRENKTLAIMEEKKIMNILNEHKNPFFIQLYFTFQDESRLFFGMNYAVGGELFHYIKELGKFDDDITRFYAAQILLAIEHLHKHGILHRDLKPENIFLNQKFHVQISDFGSAFHGTPESIKHTYKEVRRRNSFVGTAQYVAPEMLKYKKSSNGTDLWAFGCIIYQMLTGSPPFTHSAEIIIFQKIVRLDYEFPENFNCDAKQLIESLLVSDEKDRLGVNDDFVNDGYVSIRSCKFFPSNIWNRVLAEDGPLKEYINSAELDQKLKCDHYGHIPVGLDDTQVTRLFGLGLSQEFNVKQKNEKNTEVHSKSVEKMNGKHADSNDLLKEPKLEKKKGLFSKLFKH